MFLKFWWCWAKQTLGQIIEFEEEKGHLQKSMEVCWAKFLCAKINSLCHPLMSFRGGIKTSAILLKMALVQVGRTNNSNNSKMIKRNDDNKVQRRAAPNEL